jgi:hypothetical protein
MKTDYYALRGWDPATGIPKTETLENLGLNDVTEDLWNEESFGKLNIEILQENL